MMLEMCPNCRTQPATVPTHYDEVTAFSFSSRSAGRLGRRDRNFSSTSTYGVAHLCVSCSDNYQRMVATRALGRKLSNIGFWVLLGGALLFGFTYTLTRGSTLLQIALALPVGLGALVVLLGSALHVWALAMKRSATRFLAK